LNHALSRIRRVECAAAVLFIDIDDFKMVNDELGHRAGDLILSAVAKRLSECMRPSDTVGRFGGDEFVIVCEDIADDDDTAARIAERVLGELRRPFTTPFGDRSLSASIGIASCDRHTLMSADELVGAADRAMYQAKMDGKGRVARASRSSSGVLA
jgi:diguanylate cyclase (GGDEF)-like protein